MEKLMGDIISVVVIVYSLIYVILTVLIALGAIRMRPGPLPNELPRVSVVLCARNEERNLRRCLDSLAALDYPPDRVEFNVVDDESTDRTLDVFQEYSRNDSRFRVFSTAGEPRVLIGKQRPLSVGIRESTGEIVMGIDADISVRPGWVKAHVGAYHKGIGIVGGTTRVDPKSSGFFTMLQACDLIAKISIAMGSAGLGLPLTIMGNNISFRREVYNSIGGFEKIQARIVEDLALMNAITRSAGCRLGWAGGMDGVADSTPEQKFGTFIEQRRRWLDELGDISLFGKFLLCFEIGMNVVFFVSVALVSQTSIPMLVAGIAWLAGYCIVLSANPGVTLRDYLFIPFMIMFQLYYGLVLMYRILNGHRKVVWKDREYTR